MQAYPGSAHLSIAPLAVLAVALVAAAPAPLPPAVELLARSGDPAPGTPPGVVFAGFGSVLADAAGRVAFVGKLSGPGISMANYYGLWQETSPGVLILRARIGDPAPDTAPGVVFAGFIQYVALAGDAQLAFRGRLAGPEVDYRNDEGIWATDATGELRLVARTGELAPGTASSWKSFSIGPVLGSGGRLAFVAQLPDGRRGIWALDSAEGLRLVALVGTQAPGAPADWSIAALPEPVFDADGSLLVRATLSVPCLACEYYRDALWRAPPEGAPTLLVLSGDPAPGTEPGVGFSSIDPVSVDAQGRVALGARVEGPGVSIANEYGIWTVGPTQPLSLLVRSLQPAPGLPEGVLLIGPQAPRAALGRVLFLGSLEGGGFSASSDQALWLARDNGAPPLLLARSGAGLPGLPADAVVDYIYFLHVANESGRILFTVELTGPGVADYSVALVLMDASGQTLMLLPPGAEIGIGAGDVRILSGADGSLGRRGKRVAAHLAFSGGDEAVARLTPAPPALPVPGLRGVGLACALALLAAAGGARLWRGRVAPRPR